MADLNLEESVEPFRNLDPWAAEVLNSTGPVFTIGRTPMKVHYAVGDIHGRDDLLEAMQARIHIDHELHHAEMEPVIVYLGDYVDGGARSLDVVDRLMRGIPGFETICLKGNHETMMLDCLETDDRQVWWTWLSNGGDETLQSLNVSFRLGGYDPSVLAHALGKERIAWLRSLKLYHLFENYLFVHAGIVPGRPLEQQKEKDLLWIRSRFLESEQDHGYCVVHGHTPTDQPELHHNRIGIDTGATSRGELTAVVLGGATVPRFLSVTGKPGTGG